MTSIARLDAGEPGAASSAAESYKAMRQKANAFRWSVRQRQSDAHRESLPKFPHSPGPFGQCVPNLNASRYIFIVKPLNLLNV